MYRDHLYAARCRKQELARELQLEVPPELGRIFARRQARIAAGCTAIAAFLAMVVHFVLVGSLGLSFYLLGAWGVAAVIYITVRLAAPHWLARQVRRLYGARDGDIFDELSQIESNLPRQFMLDRVHRLENRSLRVPMVAVALVAPLSIHLLVALGLLSVSLYSFSHWIVTSLILVGHAHLTLAVFAAVHAGRLQGELDQGRRSPSERIPLNGAPRGLVALLWTVGASAIPGVVLLCIPPLLVALTGLLFVPWIFHWASQRAVSERKQLIDLGLDPAPRADQPSSAAPSTGP